MGGAAMEGHAQVPVLNSFDYFDLGDTQPR